ncbi:MAG: hypothetical protein AAFR35_08055 [Pseudomonadota bacterium]
MIRPLALIAACAATPALAHKLVVFAEATCNAVTVEAKFSSGRVPVEGEIRIKDGSEALLATFPLDATAAQSIPLDGLATEDGLLVEVDTGSHENYWILTPADLSAACQG